MAEEILPGLYGIDLDFVNVFVLVDEAVTLVDAGLPDHYERIEAGVKEAGRTLGELDNLVLTHHHGDHIGCVPKIPTPEIFVHKLDAPIVQPTAERPMTEVADREEIPRTGGLQSVHTPGHTKGHIALLHPDKRVLIVGDAIGNIGALGLLEQFNEDNDEAARSCSILAALDFDTAVFGHGTVLRGKANAEFRKFVDSLAV
jgi:glyoxylase-like metal-dependent hydrolase (beta-lactamase superfamily II)